MQIEVNFVSAQEQIAAEINRLAERDRDLETGQPERFESDEPKRLPGAARRSGRLEPF